jgi:hypothetical protein
MPRKVLFTIGLTVFAITSAAQAEIVTLVCRGRKETETCRMDTIKKETLGGCSFGENVPLEYKENTIVWWQTNTNTEQSYWSLDRSTLALALFFRANHQQNFTNILQLECQLYCKQI